MAKVKASETKPEIAVRKLLFSKGYRYRKNVKTLPGKPDIILSRYKLIIFVHGCFWHSHENCEASILPKSNLEYWNKKISSNVARDKRHILELQSQGWRVLVIWECTIKKILTPNSFEQNELLSYINYPL